MKMPTFDFLLSGSREQPSRLRLLLVLVFFCIIAGCVPQAKVNIPVYREEPQGRIVPPPSQADTLLADANKAMEAGQLDKAEMLLERALRMSPRDAQLWQGMARIRFEQGNYAQAVQFCLKSNSLAGRNEEIVRQNWLLMEKAYMKSGDNEKAVQASQKASEIN